MRIVQILKVLAFGDAIGNHVIALQRAFRENRIKTKIYAEVIDARLPEGTAEDYGLYEEMDEDVILYHLSTGTELNRKVTEHKCKIIINYHNITPPEYFAGYNRQGEINCITGLEDAAYLSDKAACCIADSRYNKEDLIHMGYRCDITVVPILIAYDDYKKMPDQKIMEQYKDEWTNIVFVGRIVPNKAQHDVINAFHHYKKYYNTKSRLILVGTYGGMEKYQAQLEEYTKKMGVEDVIYPGHIRFDEILAFYQCADLFLCQSEHEGFGVPLIEAMIFGVPVVAYDSSAVGETLGGAGILLDKKDPLETAAVMNRVITDETLRRKLIENGYERLKDFDNQATVRKFIDYIRMNQNNCHIQD